MTVVPFFIMKRAAVGAGIICSFLCVPYKQFARKHLRSAFPDWTSTQINVCIRRVFIHFSMAFTELIYFSRRQKPLHILVDEKAFLNILNSCKRLIFLTAHIGNWEIIPFIVKELEPDLQATIVARVQSNRYLNYLLDQFRRSQGFTILDRRKNPYRLYSSLARSSHLAFLADQSLKSNRKEWVTFFGRPAPTPSALAAIAIKRRFTFLPVFCIRRDFGVYELILHEPFEATRFSDVRELTQHYTFIIEKIVRQFPEQWVWFHKRWREKT